MMYANTVWSSLYCPATFLITPMPTPANNKSAAIASPSNTTTSTSAFHAAAYTNMKHPATLLMKDVNIELCPQSMLAWRQP